MSQWTHIAGVIRIDALPPSIMQSPVPIEDILQMALAGTAKGAPPRGSEGPLRWDLHRHESEGAPLSHNHQYAWDEINNPQWGTVTLSGDLRDFGAPEDLGSIQEWLEEALIRLRAGRLIIRDFILSADVESLGRVVWYPGSRDDVSPETPYPTVHLFTSGHVPVTVRKREAAT